MDVRSERIGHLAICIVVILAGLGVIYTQWRMIRMMITPEYATIERVIVFPKTRECKCGMFTSYNAEVGQTDGDPFTMASGKRVYEGAVANNCLPFGTRLSVPGYGELVVEDRMNRRYGCDTFDIFHWNSADNFTKVLPYRAVDNS